MGPPHLGVYLCKAENEIGGDQRGITLTGEIFLQINVDNDNISLSLQKSRLLESLKFIIYVFWRHYYTFRNQNLILAKSKYTKCKIKIESLQN